MAFSRILLLAAAFAGPAFAAPELSTKTLAGRSNRGLLSAGVYLSIMGDPYPSLAGANLAINVLDFLRLTAGIGGYTGAAGSSLGAGSTAAAATSYAAGLRALMPGWSFSPMVGVSYTHLHMTSGPANANVQGFGASGEYWYASMGLEWQSPNGFNVGAGCNVAMLATGTALPYINIGYFFPLI